MNSIAVLVGSLRKQSINKKLAQSFAQIGKDFLSFEYIPLDDIPMFNQDIEGNPPESVASLRKRIQESDGVLFVTPEYNRSIPAVLKNAIDWASRPYGKNSFSGKPAATAGITPGSIGTAVAQSHLKSIIIMLNMKVMGQPELFLGNSNDFFDSEGNVANENSKKFLHSFLEKFNNWISLSKNK